MVRATIGEVWYFEHQAFALASAHLEISGLSCVRMCVLGLLGLSYVSVCDRKAVAAAQRTNGAVLAYRYIWLIRTFRTIRVIGLLGLPCDSLDCLSLDHL